MKKNKVIRIFILLLIAMVLMLLSSLAYSSLQERKIVYRLFEDAHQVRQIQETNFQIKATEKVYLNYFDVNTTELYFHEAFDALISAEQLQDPKLLTQYFGKQALNLFTDYLHNGYKLVFLDGSLNVDFAQKNGSFLLLSGTLNYAVEFTEASTKKLETGQIDVQIGLEKFAFNPKITIFNVFEKITPQRKARNVRDVRFDGINYYPANSNWSQFWSQFQIDLIEKDFALIKTLNANGVRIFLTEADFKSSNSSQNFDNLVKLLDVARSNSLRVIVTLFDLKSDYERRTLAENVRFIKKLNKVLEPHDFDIIFDLKNEVDLDFENHDKDKVKFWLKSLLYFVGIESDVPVTIGWSDIRFALENFDDVDIISYHDYRDLDEAKDLLSNLKGKISTKPIYVTEVGEISANLFLGFPSSEQQQASRLAARLDANQLADGIAIWSLFDFNSIDPIALGNSPWVHFIQKSYGLYSANYVSKPASEVAKEFFAKQ